MLEDIALLIILLKNFFERKDKNTKHYSICYNNHCSKWTAKDFGYVKVHKITLLVVPDMLSCNFFLGWHVLKINMTTLLSYLRFVNEENLMFQINMWLQMQTSCGMK